MKEELSKFISDIPMEKIDQRLYSVEEAKSIYRDQYRDRIFNELKVQHIQQKIRNKILKRNCSADKDILFRKIDFGKQVDAINISGLISEDGEDYEPQDDEELQDYELQDDEVQVEDLQDDEVHKSAKQKDLVKRTSQKSCKFLDLEAEHSGEDDEEEEEEDESDVSSIVDDYQLDENTAADLYAGEKKEKDLEVLKSLVKKFKKKKSLQIREVHQKDVEDFSSSEELFSEIPVEDFEFKKEPLDFETTKEENLSDVQTSSIKFRNLDDACENLNKKKKFTFKKL